MRFDSAGYFSATQPGMKNVAGSFSAFSTLRMRSTPTFGP